MQGDIQRVVVIGHSGFIGSQVMRAVREYMPEIDIIGRSFPELDLTSREDLLSLSEFFSPRTAVILLSGIKKQMGDTLEIFSQNMVMIENFAYFLREHPVKHLVYFSSAEVYGEDVQNTAIHEKTPVNPASYYGVAKYASEGLLRKVIRSQSNSPLTILRPPLIYGAGDTSRGYGPTGFAWAAASGKEITLWGDGSELREFISLEDLAAVACRFVFQPYDGVVNVATGQNHNFQEIISIIQRVSEQPVKVVSRERSKAKVDQGYSNTLIQETLPGFVFTTLEDGIRRLYDTVKQQVS